jgi:hypothetical protein
VKDVNSDEERGGMTNLQLDWSTAEVSEGKLTVSLDEKPSEDWATSFERTATLLDRGTWPEIELKKREITVGRVDPGSEEKLRFFLDSVVQEANAEQGSDEEDDAAAEQEREDEDEDEKAKAQADPDDEMTERFRSFAGGSEESSEA